MKKKNCENSMFKFINFSQKLHEQLHIYLCIISRELLKLLITEDNLTYPRLLRVNNSHGTLIILFLMKTLIKAESRTNL